MAIVSERHLTSMHTGLCVIAMREWNSYFWLQEYLVVHPLMVIHEAACVGPFYCSIWLPVTADHGTCSVPLHVPRHRKDVYAI